MAWGNTLYPAALDNTVNWTALRDGFPPVGELAVAADLNKMRDGLIAVQTEVGKTAAPAVGSVRERLALLEAAPGGGFVAYEEAFTASAGPGAKEFTLSTTPAVNANTLSGRNILGVFREGKRSVYNAAPTLGGEYSQSGGVTKINVVAQAGGEDFVVVFGV